MAERIQTPIDERGWFSVAPGVWLLWGGLLAGPVAWALNLTISYALVQWTCSTHLAAVLRLVPIGALALTAAGAAASWTALRRAEDRGVADGARPVDRGKFMATIGLLVSASFALAIVSTLVPQVLLDACL